MDRSVLVPQDRSEIMAALGPMANQNFSTEKLAKTLAKKLKETHPIHKKIRALSDPQLMNLCVSLFGRKIKGRDRKMKAISNHFFEEFPNAPLRNLERIMEEDTYFAQLTSGEVDAEQTGFDYI